MGDNRAINSLILLLIAVFGHYLPHGYYSKVHLWSSFATPTSSTVEYTVNSTAFVL